MFRDRGNRQANSTPDRRRDQFHRAHIVVFFIVTSGDGNFSIAHLDIRESILVGDNDLV